MAPTQPRTTRTGFLLSASALFTSCLVCLLLCPHSKVEESFQLQATHDLYYHGFGPILRSTLLNDSDATQKATMNASSASVLPYDHLQYPGVVPRTFTGPIILATMCHILLLPQYLLRIPVSPLYVQFLARFCLMSLNVFGWLRLAWVVDRRKTFRKISDSRINAMTTGSWVLLITACQFHVPFYSSRMLPNVFALSMVLQSYTYWVDERIRPAASLLVAATAIFRCDLLLLLGSLGLSWLSLSQLTIPQALKIGIVTGVVSLAVTVPFDSVMWQRPLWPEGEVFYFNTILGKSKEWGTSPWHWYFSTALPKAMLLTLLLVPLSTFRIAELAVAIERNIRSGDRIRVPPMAFASLVDTGRLQYTIPVVGFVVLYSFLGHKEVRFIFPALPILNLAAAEGMSKLVRLAVPENDKKEDDQKETMAQPSWLARVGLLCGYCCIVLTLCGSLAFLAVSKSNYPGGDALLELSSYVQNLAESTRKIPLSSTIVHVHIDVAAAMSGVSLFGQRAAAEGSINSFQWEFSKDGYEEGHSVEGEEGYGAYTHLLSEDPDVGSSTFHVIRTIEGRPRLSLRERRIITQNAIYILERNGWRDSLNLGISSNTF